MTLDKEDFWMGFGSKYYLTEGQVEAYLLLKAIQEKKVKIIHKCPGCHRFHNCTASSPYREHRYLACNACRDKMKKGEAVLK